MAEADANEISVGEERRREILETAACVFARHGFRGATTKRLAEAAQISEALLYKHFSSKRELFAAVLSQMAESDSSENPLAPDCCQLDDEDFLAHLAGRLHRHFARQPEKLRILLFSALQGHELSSEYFKIQVRKYYDALIERIEAGKTSGLYRQMPAAQAARAFIGMVHYHMMIQVLFEDPIIAPQADMGRLFAQIFLNGIRKDSR